MLPTKNATMSPSRTFLRGTFANSIVTRGAPTTTPSAYADTA